MPTLLCCLLVAAGRLCNNCCDFSRRNRFAKYSKKNVQTQTLPIISDTAQATAYALLLADQPLVAPTDTVYGVMCRFDSSIGIDRLYEAKQRPPQNGDPGGHAAAAG